MRAMVYEDFKSFAEGTDYFTVSGILEVGESLAGGFTLRTKSGSICLPASVYLIFETEEGTVDS